MIELFKITKDLLAAFWAQDKRIGRLDARKSSLARLEI